MYEHGMTNSVATLGIATNRFHIQKLLQIVNEIIFCFDGDDAVSRNPAVVQGEDTVFVPLWKGRCTNVKSQ